MCARDVSTRCLSLGVLSRSSKGSHIDQERERLRYILFTHIRSSVLRTMAKIKGLFFLLFVSVVVGTATSKFINHPGVPKDWASSGRVEPATKILLQIAITQNEAGKEKLENELLARSDPENKEMYGKWLSKEQVDNMLRNTKATEAVTSFIRSHFNGPQDVYTLTSAGDFLQLETTAAKVESMVKASYHHYTHKNGRTTIMRLSSSYEIPEEIAQHVDFIGPSHRFPLLQSLKMVDASATPNDNVTPDFLKKLYNVGSAKGAPDTKNIQACASFLNQYYEPNDLAKFQSKYVPDAKVTKPKVYGPDKSSAGIEASLDIEYIMAMGEDVPTQFWSTNGQQPHNPSNEPFLVWLQNLSNLTDSEMPLSMSVSYGDNEPGVDFDYATRVNTEFQKAGARGMSLMFSSGDGGVSGGQSQPCDKFVATFPAGSPWVTAVGGTTGSNPEVAASLSSGGFSSYWARPSYQESHVQAYFKAAGSSLPDSSKYNSTGNGFPDVAAQAESFMVVWNGISMAVAGTSCASPSFTGVLSLLNEDRLKDGKSSLGFINPLLYKSLHTGFNDITSGSNPGCYTNGFSATEGWDPVTGFGSPDYEKLSGMLKSLP